jgi:hypothetical protein
MIRTELPLATSLPLVIFSFINPGKAKEEVVSL